MAYKLIAKDANETIIEFAKNNEELTFSRFEEAEAFVIRVKNENRWAADYEFSIIENN
ncbi:hypothetical protein [Halobacillus andaensis]|uniref:hypothetical protein n=1 Tax=Halobacillus andaensis TaxID=1176239 RepID=UPI003D73992E